MYMYDLMHVTSGSEYSTRRDPTLSNEFLVAAFRFGHSQVNDVLPFKNFALNLHADFPLEDVSF